MNKSFFLRSVLGLALSTACLTPAIVHAEKTTELGAAMDDMNGAFRRLSRQVKDAGKNADSLAQLAALKKASQASLAHIPELAAEQPADKREKFVAAYRDKMDEFIKAIDQLDAALQANDNAKATDLVEELKTLRNQGHKAYKKPEPK